MEYAIIGICVVAVMAVCVLLFCRAWHRKGGAVSLENTPETVRAADCSDIVVDDESEKFEIPVEVPTTRRMNGPNMTITPLIPKLWKCC